MPKVVAVVQESEREALAILLQDAIRADFPAGFAE